MGDVLLELSKNPGAKKAIRKLGLPLPLPQVLRRAAGPWEEKPLDGVHVVQRRGVGGHTAASDGADSEGTSREDVS